MVTVIRFSHLTLFFKLKHTRRRNLLRHSSQSNLVLWAPLRANTSNKLNSNINMSLRSVINRSKNWWWWSSRRNVTLQGFEMGSQTQHSKLHHLDRSLNRTTKRKRTYSIRFLQTRNPLSSSPTTTSLHSSSPPTKTNNSTTSSNSNTKSQFTSRQWKCLSLLPTSRSKLSSLLKRRSLRTSSPSSTILSLRIRLSSIRLTMV